MASDLQFIDANINNYEDIPSSKYGILSGVYTTQVSVNHQTKPVIDGTVSDGTGVYVRWKYPVSDNKYIRVAVGYQLQIVEGTYASSQSQGPNAPGSIVYEEIVNLKTAALPENRYINLQGNIFGRVDVPPTVLKPGVRYTARVRVLIFSELGDGTLDGQYFKYTQFGVVNFRVNNIPAAINLRTNGQANPTAILRRDPIEFSFSFIDSDGPNYLYRVQVGTVPGGSFTASIWDSGLISGGKGVGNREFRVPYTGTPLSPGVTYAWRVQVQDGLADGGYTSATDTFKINALPTVSSLKIDGNEILFGLEPTVANTGVSLTWIFSDPDGDTQRGYNLEVVQTEQAIAIADDFLNGTSTVFTSNSDTYVVLETGNVFTAAATVALPDLPEGGTIVVRLRVRDAVEFGDEIVATFKANARPQALDLRVDAKTNPGDVASSTPTISWTFFDSTIGDVQSAFRIQVATTDSFAALLWDSGNVSSNLDSVVYGSTASPIVAPTALTHGQYYFVRVRLSDGISFSDWTSGFFAVNTKPESPLLLSPSSGAFSGVLAVTWMPAGVPDADGDTVTYTLEITTRRSGNIGWEFLAGPFPSTTTSYNLDLGRIKAGNDYGIRVIANDGFTDSNPALGSTSPVNSLGLGFSILNHPPESPTIVKPQAGDAISSVLLVEWVEGNPVDIDGDSVFYVVEITRDATVSSPIYEKLAVAQEGTARVFVDVSEFPDGTKYKLKVTSFDDKGGIGTPSYSETFSVINTPAVTDFERLGANLYLATSDGRVFKASESIWQLEEDFGTDDYSQFQKFKSGSPSVKVDKGALSIESPAGSSFILRIGK